MSEEEKNTGKEKSSIAFGGYTPEETNKGFQPIEKGYQPSAASGSGFTPPQGGSGVPKKIQKSDDE